MVSDESRRRMNLFSIGPLSYPSRSQVSEQASTSGDFSTKRQWISSRWYIRPPSPVFMCPIFSPLTVFHSSSEAVVSITGRDGAFGVGVAVVASLRPLGGVSASVQARQENNAFLSSQNLVYVEVSISIHFLWNHTSHESQAIPCWFFRTPLEQTPHGSVTGPGFSSKSPGSRRLRRT